MKNTKIRYLELALFRLWVVARMAAVGKKQLKQLREVKMRFCDTQFCELLSCNFQYILIRT